MSKILGKQNKAFGLDISDSSIKVMELAFDKSDYVLQASGSLVLPDKIISNHLIINEQGLADQIRRATTTARKIDTDYVVCSIPEAKSFVRTVSIPKMSDAEIEGAIPFELEQDIPIPIDQVYLDWQKLREGPDKLDLLVTAASKDYIDSLVSALHLANLRPVAMELESQASARALIDPNSQSTVLIVDLATKQTTFIIVNSGIIEYTSSIPIAGNAFTESIARNLGVGKTEAEKMKWTVGLTEETKQGNVRQALLPILDNIVDEIKNVVRFYEEHNLEHKSVQSVMLAGGSAKLGGITEYISARINLGSTKSLLKISLADPWTNVSGHKVSKSAPTVALEALEFTTVIGLALRGIKYENY